MQMLYLDIISFIYDQIVILFVHRVQFQFHVDPFLFVDDLLDEIDSSHQGRPARTWHNKKIGVLKRGGKCRYSVLLDV